MSTTPHPDPDPSDRTEPLTQPIGTTPGGTKDADERREPRVATIVWGLILVAVAAGVLAVAQGVDVLRVHDVRVVSRAVRVADAIVRGYRE